MRILSPLFVRLIARLIYQLLAVLLTPFSRSRATGGQDHHVLYPLQKASCSISLCSYIIHGRSVPMTIGKKSSNTLPLIEGNITEDKSLKRENKQKAEQFEEKHVIRECQKTQEKTFELVYNPTNVFLQNIVHKD